MKSAQINQYGDIDNLQISDKQQQKLAPGEVFINIYAASINPFDLILMKGNANYLKLDFPITLGGDFSGKIVNLGEGVNNYQIGDEVYGTASVAAGGSGAFAEIVKTPINTIALKPKAVDFKEASALPLVGVSAIQAIEENIQLKNAQKILIHGGAGGIGHIAIQLAKALGAYVATTVNTDDMDFALAMGANEVIDYKKHDFNEMLKDYDAVFDTVGGDTTDKSFQVLKKGGTLVSMKGQPNEELAKKFSVKTIGQYTAITTERLNRLSELVNSRKIKVNIDQVFTLDEIKEAFHLQESHPRGKVVIEIKE
jgi:NADPH:quinone reductase-like Zn-dependent oxidoreductase